MALPAAFALCAWGFGGEDYRFSGAALAVLFSVAAITVLCTMRGREELDLPRLRCLLPAACLMALAVAMTIFSVNRFASLVGIVHTGALAVAFLMVASAPARSAHRILAACVTVVGMLSVYGFMQSVGFFESGYWYNGQFASRFVNSAHFGAMVAVAIVVGVGLAPCLKGAWRFAVLASIPANAAAMLQTRSRAVWILAALVYTFVFLFAGIRLRSQERRTGRWVLAGMLLAVLCLGAGGYLLRHSISDRFAQLATTQFHAIFHRADILRDSAMMIRANPMGVGAGCYEDAILRYKIGVDRSVANHAHNEVFEIVGELGWAAFPLLIWLIVAIGRDFRAAASRCAPNSLLLASALAAGLSIYALHSLVDFPLRLMANSLFAAFILGALLNKEFTGAEGMRTLAAGRLAKLLLPALCAALAAFCCLQAASAIWTASAESHLLRLRMEDARQALVKSSFWMPLDPRTAYLRGNAAYAMSAIAPEPRKSALRSEALEWLRRAASIASTHADTHLRLAWIRADLGQSRDAIESFRKAISCDPKLGIYHFYYAEYLLALKQWHEAAKEYRTALETFNDNSIIGAESIFRKILVQSGDEAIAEEACPSEPGFRASLERVLRERKK